MEDLDLIAEVADGPLLIEALPDGSSTSLATIATTVVCTISTTIATHFCASECAGTAATTVCGPCAG